MDEALTNALVHSLPVIAKAVKTGEVAPRHLALIADRVVRAHGKPQVYGSDWAFADGELTWTDGIAEPETADERRAFIGLPPLAEDEARILSGHSLTP